MGIDLFDIRFRLQKEFSIELDLDDLMEIIERRDPIEYTSCWGLHSSSNDIRFQEVVEWVKFSFGKVDVEPQNDIYERTKKITVYVLGVDDDEVTPEALLTRDLGMD